MAVAPSNGWPVRTPPPRRSPCGAGAAPAGRGCVDRSLARRGGQRRRRELHGRLPRDRARCRRQPTTPPRCSETPSIERTADGWVGFNTNAPHQIAGFLRMMGRDDLVRQRRVPLLRQPESRWTSGAVGHRVDVGRTTDEIIERAVATTCRSLRCATADGAELDQAVARGGARDGPERRFRMPLPALAHQRRSRARPATGAGLPTAPHGLPQWTARRHRRPRPRRRRPAGRPLAGVAGPRPDRMVGRTGGDAGCSPRSGPTSSTSRRPPAWTACGWSGDVLRPARVVGAELVLPRHQHEQAGPRARPRERRGPRARARADRPGDVVVENFTPRVLDKLGLGWDAMHAANPRAVLVRMPAFGLDGPWRERPGIRADDGAGGRPRVGDRPARRPTTDPAGPVRPERRRARGVRRARRARERDRTGEGSLVEAAHVRRRDAASRPRPTSSGRRTAPASSATATERRRGRPAGRVPGARSDAWLAVSATTDDEWRALAAVIGRPDSRGRGPRGPARAGGRATTA